MFKFALKGLCLSVAIATFYGCDSNSSSKVDDPISSGATLSTPVTISGTAAKGIVANGIVSAFSIVNGVKSTESIVTTTTNASGQYDLVLNAGSPDAPYIIEVSAGNDTTVRCDIPAGCDNGTVFGEVFDLVDNTFMLSTVVADVSVEDSEGNTATTQTANTNVFTHIATQEIIESLTVGQGISSIQSSIQSVKSSVNARFGFVGDLTTLPVIDITDADAVNAADESTLRFSVFNSAVVSATIENEGGSITIVDAITTFTTQFTGGGLADVESTSSSTVSLVEVLTNASTVMTSVSNITGVTSTTVSTVITSINNSVTITTSTGSTVPTKGTPSPTAGDTDVAQAKAFMQDLRLLSQDSFFADADEAEFDSLAAKAEMVNQIDVDNMVEGVELMLAGASAANRAYTELDAQPTPLGMPFSAMIDGLEYSVTAVTSEGALVLNVSQADTTLNMVATVNDLSSDEDEFEDQNGDVIYQFDDIANMTLAGSVQVGSSRVSVQELSVDALGEGIEVSNEASINVGQVLDIDLNGMFTIEQLGAADIVDLTLSGNATFTFKNVFLSNRFVKAEQGESVLVEEMLGFDSLTLALNGDIAHSSGTQLDVAVALALDAFDVSNDCDLGSGCPSIETVDNFIPATLILSFEGFIGNQSNTRATVTLMRISEDDASVIVALDYDGKRMVVSTQTDRDGATIMNQDNIVAVLDKGESSLADGEIKKGEKLLADIVTTSNDLVLIRYVDGTVESL